MTFELTDKLADSLIFAMEDQGKEYVVDASSASLLQSDIQNTLPHVDDEFYYAIPLWISADGYTLLEDFTNNLYAPVVRKELHQVLTGGRGVFRNFKNVLKQYPEIEKKWHLYKYAKMKERVLNWYNALRDMWGMERLLYSIEDIAEDTSELVQKDFDFTEYDFSKDAHDVEVQTEIAAKEYGDSLEEFFGLEPFFKDLKDFAALTRQKKADLAPALQKKGIICRSLSNEIAGILLTSSCYDCAESNNKKAVAVTDFYVPYEFRGLGIGSQLLKQTVSLLKKLGTSYVLIDSVVPHEIEPLLERYEFKKTSFGFVANIENL